jgi:DeoR/GlpR family transcriptional regulator of sugar metabolism
MTTIRDYAKKHKISEKTARRQLDRMVERGEMERLRGPNNLFLYKEKPKTPAIKWHDPFNRINCKPKTEVLET